MSIKIGEKKILRSPLEPKDKNWLWLKTVAGFPVLYEYLSGKWIPVSDATAEYVEANILSRVFGSTKYDKAGHCIEFYAADGSDIPIGVIDMSEFEIPLDADDYYTKDEVEDFVAEYVSEHGGGSVDIEIDSAPTEDSEKAVSSGGVFLALDNKVDKVSGKGLSANDYTTAEKTKLAGISAGAEVNVQPNWTQTNTSADDYIKNKPTKVSDFTNDSGFTSNAGTITGITMNSTSKGTSGVVDLGTVITAHQDISGKANTSDVYTKTQTDTLLAGKQDTLTFDTTPTAYSTNPVTSGGIKTYVDGKASITGITTSQDGTFTIAQSDGNSYTVDLNHVHPQYLKYELLADEAAYTALATKDSSTLYLIPEA